MHIVNRKTTCRAALIATEDLSIANLVTRPKAKHDEQTGQYLPNGACQKAGLNRAILDGAPTTFLAMLRYKAAEAGTVYGEAPTQRLAPSQSCHQCGRREKKTLAERQHTCVCGASCGRDANSALVLVQWGVEQLYVVLLAWAAVGLRSQELTPCPLAQNLPLEPQA
jgi:putative transposase